MTQQELYERLLSLQDLDYRAFHSSLLPGVDNILGVRAPLMRKIAKEIAAGEWREYLAEARIDTYEETMVQGMVIGQAKGNAAEILPYVAAFVPKIDNWAVCDSFCCVLKLAKREPDPVWDFLQPYFVSKEPFDLRFAIVMALDHYIDDAHIEVVIGHIDAIKHEHYYVKMAAAWAVSICFVHYPEITMAYLLNNSLDDFTFSKSISKILESYRVSAQDKEALRALRKSKAGR